MLAEPGVLDRRVAEDQVEQDAEAAFVGCRDELFEVGQRAELRVDGGVVGHVVPEVGERRRVDGGEPEGVDAEPREVVEPLRDTAEIPDAVTVRVLKRPWIDLIDDRLLPPGHGRRGYDRRPGPEPWPRTGSPAMAADQVPRKAQR